jgi:hypothetical protein
MDLDNLMKNELTEVNDPKIQDGDEKVERESSGSFLSSRLYSLCIKYQTSSKITTTKKKMTTTRKDPMVLKVI